MVQTVLHSAVSPILAKANVDNIHNLIAVIDDGKQKEAFINIADNNNKTALHLAIEKGNIKIIDTLIDAGGIIKPELELSPLHLAVKEKNTLLVKHHYEKNPGVSKASDLFSECDDLEILNFLIDKKHPHIESGRALSNAVRRGRHTFIAPLISRGGANPDQKDNIRDLPLLHEVVIGAIKQDTNTLTELLKHCHVNAKDQFNYTALHYLMEYVSYNYECHKER